MIKNRKTYIAEILIEKHRNGAVGKIELYFDEKQVTFLDIENKPGNEGYAAMAQSSGLDVF